MKSLTASTLLFALLAVIGFAWSLDGQAAVPTTRAGMAQLGDPYVPSRVKAHARAMGLQPQTSGSSLQKQALGKLRQKFNEADREQSGRISRQQAQQAGFGFVANHFDAIDRQHRGSISFDELKAYLRANGAAF